MASNAVNRVDQDIITHTDAHTFSGMLTASGAETHSGTETHSGAVTLSGATTLSGTVTVSGTLNQTGASTQSVGTLAAAGNAQGNAAQIVNKWTTVTAANGTKGVILPAGVVGIDVVVINTVAQALNVYPQGASGTIDGGTGAAAVAQPASKVGTYRCTATGPDTWYSQMGA